MIGGDFDTPIMYQDLANSSLGTMPYTTGIPPAMYGYGMGGLASGSSYLGGVQMRQQPDRDKIEIMHKKENQDKSTLKKVLWVIGGAIVLGSIPVLRKSIRKAGGLSQYAKNCLTSLKHFVTGKPKQGNWFTRLFSRKKSTTAQTP